MDRATAAALQSEMNQYVTQMQSTQQSIQKLALQKSKIETQKHENEMVQNELTIIKDQSNDQSGNQVYKLSGPVLIKVDLDEALSNVQARLKFFDSEMYDFALYRFNQSVNQSIRANQSINHSFIQSFSQSLNHSIVQSLNQSFISHSFNHSLCNQLSSINDRPNQSYNHPIL
jgi:chaperonin cofactor prefoldin